MSENVYAFATYEIVDNDNIPEKISRSFQGIWIPKELWFDKNLSWIEKLFLVEINSLDNEMGCFASNNYFSDFFNLSPSRCSRVIKALNDKKYISIKYDREGKRLKKRVLKILKRGIAYSQEGIAFPQEGIAKTQGGYCKNAQGSINTINNININNIYIPYFEKWESLPSLPKHKVGTVKHNIKKRHIDKLKDYTEEEIMSAIEAYNEILSNPDKYWFKYKFTFWNFIMKIDTFTPNMTPLKNFKKESKENDTSIKQLSQPAYREGLK